METMDGTRRPPANKGLAASPYPAQRRRGIQHRLFYDFA